MIQFLNDLYYSVILSQQGKNPENWRVEERDSSLLLRMTLKRELLPIRPSNTAGRRAGLQGTPALR